MDQVQNARMAADDFFEQWPSGTAPGSNFNGRVRRPVDWPDTLCEELRKLATAIGEGSAKVEKPEHRIELTAAQSRCRALADQIASWIGQSAADQVYWVELEERARLRIRLASAPLDVGPSLRKLLFDQVPTCVLTSATLCVGSRRGSISSSRGWV